MARKTPGIYIAIRGDYSAFETDLNHAKLVAKEQGEAIAKSIGNAVSKADLTGGINKITRELKTAQAALSSGAFKAQVSGLDEIAKAAGVSSKQLEGLTNSMLKSQAAATANRAFEYLQKNAGLSTLQLAKLRVELGDTSGAFSTLATGVKAHAVGVLAFGAAAAMAGKQVLDASLQMDRLNKAYATITGSSSAAQNQLDYMYDVTQRLGLQFQGTAEAAKGFFAAGKDSALKDHLNGIFESVSMAGSALALSKDQMDGVFLALGQMISKGKVQAEELRGQLGERLPGAFDMAAKAMGVTTAKLDDMLKKGQVTAEEMLPKLAKVLHDDFAVAAAEASQGLQGQLNRLSTEWTRFQASLLNGDAAAKVMKQLASGMKVLADHGAEIASIVGKGIQWAVWTAGVYAAIKALSGLGAAVTAAKAALVAFNVSSVAAAVGSLSGLLGPAGLAAAAGAAIVAFTSLSSSTQSADDIFRKHQATIDDYKEKMGKATDAVKTFSEEQEEAYRKSLERQRDILNTDIADAVKGVNGSLADVSIFGAGIAKAPLIQEAKETVEELGRELAKLGQNVTQDDLNVYAEKVSAIDERVRSSRLATKEWNDAITALVGEGNSFVLKLAAMSAQGERLDDALETLRQTTANAKSELATGWTIGLDGVGAALGKLDERLRKAKAQITGIKGMADAAATFKDFSVDQLEALQQALEKGGRGAVIKKLGEDYHVAAEQIQEVSGALTQYFGRLKVTTEAEEKASELEKERKKKHSGKASAIEQTSTKLETLRKEVAALEEANIPAAKSFDQVVAKLELERKNAVAAAEETAKLSVQRKQATATQATEQKALEIRKAELVYTQKLREAEAKRDDDLKKNADLRLDFEKRYADMVGLSSEAVSKSISKQAEEYRKAIEAGENAAEELVRLEEWKRDQIQRASREAMDGAQVALRDYHVEASNQAKSMNDAFRGLFSGMDSGWKSAWEQMVEDGKVSLSSFKSLFASFLADLMHMAITRPITVQIAGVVSGMLGTGGVAYAAGGSGGGAGGLLGNVPLSNLSSFLPDSFTSSLSGIMGATLPGTVSALTTPGAYTAGEILLMQGGGTTAGTVGGQAALMSGGLSLGSALMYGGLGSLGYSLLGGALGLPQNKYSGITSGLGAGLGAWGASAALSGTALGATLGSAVPVVGTVIGAALGGLASSLFGGGKKTHPSVYTNVVDASLFGSDWEALMTQGAWTDRASVSDAAGIFKGLGEVANTTASSIMGFAQALPEEYQAQVLARLNAETVSFGRGSTAGRKGVTDYGPSTWNFQFHDEEQLQEVINTAGEDIQRVMLNALQRAMAGTDLSSMLAVDLSSTEGLDKAIQAINAINTVTEATANIKEPLSEMEQQAKAARAQLDEWTESMRSLGVNADYAGKLMEDYRHAYIDNVIESLDESLHPLSAYAQAVKTANEAVDQRKKALEIIGATEGQLAQVEAMRAEVVRQATEEMLRSFDQSVAQRWAAVNGNSDEVGRAISQANELRETIQQFGEGSAQVAELLKLHAAETAKAAQDAAKSEYDSLKAQMDALEQQRVQLQQQAIQEQINAINEQINTAKTLKSTWEGLDKSLGQSRYNLFAGSANLDAENRLGTVQAEFRRLSGLALGGDSDAAGQLAGVGNSLLDLVKQTVGTEEEYLDAFWAVNAQLRNAQDAAGAQVSAADKELEALQGQLDVQNAALAELQGQSATLEEIEKQIAELRPLLDAAGQKAGVKAFARGGLAMPGWSLVGEEGPELVNFSQPGRVYTAADTAALFRSVTPRAAADTDSGSDAEVKALRREVYQLRRDMLISMSEIARFSRRTSDMVEAWDAEGMPGVRA